MVQPGCDNPLISLAVGVSLLSAMTGSASGAMSVALANMGDTYVAMDAAANIAPELLHRVTSVAAGVLDILPHNGAVITLLAICGLTHKQAFLDIAVAGIVMPLIALVALIVVGTLFASFSRRPRAAQPGKASRSGEGAPPRAPPLLRAGRGHWHAVARPPVPEPPGSFICVSGTARVLR